NTGGNVALGAVNAASITASGAITAAPGVSLTGGTVTLTAGTGIGASGSPIQTNVTSLNATTASGDIYISQASSALTVSASSQGAASTVDVTASGDLTVGAISALGPVILQAAGAIRDETSGANETAQALDISGDTLNVVASKGIGTAGAPLDTSVNSLTADGGTGGGLFLANRKALTLTSATATGGAGSVSATRTLTLGTATGAGPAVTP